MEFDTQIQILLEKYGVLSKIGTGLKNVAKAAIAAPWIAHDLAGRAADKINSFTRNPINTLYGGKYKRGYNDDNKTAPASLYYKNRYYFIKNQYYNKDTDENIIVLGNLTKTNRPGKYTGRSIRLIKRKK